MQGAIAMQQAQLQTELPPDGFFKKYEGEALATMRWPQREKPESPRRKCSAFEE